MKDKTRSGGGFLSSLRMAPPLSSINTPPSLEPQVRQAPTYTHRPLSAQDAKTSGDSGVSVLVSDSTEFVKPDEWSANDAVSRVNHQRASDVNDRNFTLSPRGAVNTGNGLRRTSSQEQSTAPSSRAPVRASGISSSSSSSFQRAGQAAGNSLVRISVQDFQAVDINAVKAQAGESSSSRRPPAVQDGEKRRRVSSSGGTSLARGSRRLSQNDQRDSVASDSRPKQSQTTTITGRPITSSVGAIVSRPKKKVTKDATKKKKKKTKKEVSAMAKTSTTTSTTTATTTGDVSMTSIERAAAFVTLQDLRVLAAFQRPPAALAALTGAVGVLFGIKSKNRDGLKKLMTDKRLPSRLASYDPTTVTPRQLRIVLKRVDGGVCDRTRMAKISTAAAYLADWLSAVLTKVREAGIRPATPRKKSPAPLEVTATGAGSSASSDVAASPRGGSASHEDPSLTVPRISTTRAQPSSPSRKHGRPTTPRREPYQLLNEKYSPTREKSPASPSHYNRPASTAKKSPRGERPKAWAALPPRGDGSPRDGDDHLPQWVRDEMAAHIRASHADAMSSHRDRTGEFMHARAAATTTEPDHAPRRQQRPQSARGRLDREPDARRYDERFAMTGSLKRPPHRDPVPVTVVSPPARARIGREGMSAGTGLRLAPRHKAKRIPGVMYEPYGRVTSQYGLDGEWDDALDGQGAASDRFEATRYSSRSPRGGIPSYPGFPGFSHPAHEELSTIDHIDNVLQTLRMQESELTHHIAEGRRRHAHPSILARDIRAHSPRTLQFDAMSPRYSTQYRHDADDDNSSSDLDYDGANTQPGLQTQMARGVALYEASLAAGGGQHRITRTAAEVADVRRPDVYQLLTSGYDRVLADLREQEYEIQKKAAMMEYEQRRDPVENWYELADVSFSAELARLNRKQGRR